MKRQIAVLATFAAITTIMNPTRADARLGESEQQLKQRYGEPMKAEPVDKFRRLVFGVQKKYLVFVILDSDKSIFEIFTRPLADESVTESDAQAMVTTLADGRQVAQLPDSTVEGIARALGGFEAEAGWSVGDTFALFNPAGLLIWFKDINKAREWLTVAQKEQTKGL